MSTVALVNGFWGQNIGNAFFNIGGEYQLRQTGHEVRLIQDSPMYWTLHSKRKPFQNWFNTVARVEADLLVLQGPLFTSNLSRTWAETASALRARGVRIGFLGASHFRYTESEIEETRRFLESIDPLFVVTRDSQTYQTVADVSNAYDGIDSAFFSQQDSRIADLELERPVVCVTVDFSQTPLLSLSRDGEVDTEMQTPVTVGDDNLVVRWRSRGESIFRRSEALRVFAPLVGRSALRRQAELPSIVAHLNHRTNPHISPLTQGRTNSVASDEPFTYLAMYRSSSLTVTDRVHAAVATLAAGRPALVRTATPRAALLDRVAEPQHRKGAVVYSPNERRLRDEKAAQLAFVSSAIA